MADARGRGRVIWDHPDTYVTALVGVFDAVRRVLRDDCTLWLNLGDYYATGAGKVGQCPGGGPQGERWKAHCGINSPGAPRRYGYTAVSIELNPAYIELQQDLTKQGALIL